MTNTIILGDNRIIDCDAVLVVEGEEVFRLREHTRDGRLVVDIDVRAADGGHIAKIVRGHVTHAAPGYEHRNSRGVAEVVETVTGKVVAKVEEIDSDTIRVIGTFNVKGYAVEIREDGVVLPGNNRISRSTVQGFGKAIVLGRDFFGIGVAR